MSNFRDEAVRLVVENGYRDLCEVGVWRGELARMLAPLARTLVLVDPWSALWNDFEYAEGRYDCTMGGPALSQHKLNEIHDDLRDDLPGALILRMPSLMATKYIPDKCLDFVFIDSVHLYSYCRYELIRWLPKIRSGGMMAGDDYSPQDAQVSRAVDEFFGAKGRYGPVWWERIT